MNQSQQSHLEVNARIGFAAKIVIRLQKNIEKSREILFAEMRSRLCERRPLVRRGRDQFGIRAANARNQKITHVANRFAAEVLKIAPFFLKRVDKAERAIC